VQHRHGQAAIPTAKKGRKKGRKRFHRAPSLPLEVLHHHVERIAVQPSVKGYGGMGFARPSLWIDVHDRAFESRYLEMYNEHVEGFSGKAFQKASVVLLAFNTNYHTLFHCCCLRFPSRLLPLNSVPALRTSLAT
jgi:hypothetical protein